MRGIYIHIPFCRKACRYCDFYFSVSLKYQEPFVDALVAEIRKKGETNPGMHLDTLYVGGGTPSVLSSPQLERIVKTIGKHYTFRKNPEWTIEGNPDDLDIRALEKLQELGFNRLSIGIQSFIKRDLDLMRRSHQSDQAERSVRLAAASGFNNISIDLIYGVPGQSSSEWEENINRALSLPVSHLSAYHLTFEPGTVFDHWRKKGTIEQVAEEESVHQYRIMRSKLIAAGFDHYELSNFSRGDKVSEHNMLYWSGKPYLGFGPSAHSFNGEDRSWNISSLKKYMERIASGNETGQTEHLSTTEKYHDYLITSLRTRRGADPAFIELQYGKKIREHFEKQVQPFLKKGNMFEAGGKLVIDPEGWLITDHILRALFI
jgi:oxygen-independent coproporphyrinogen III oxidase